MPQAAGKTRPAFAAAPTTMVLAATSTTYSPSGGGDGGWSYFTTFVKKKRRRRRAVRSIWRLSARRRQVCDEAFADNQEEHAERS